MIENWIILVTCSRSLKVVSPLDMHTASKAYVLLKVFQGSMSLKSRHNLHGF